MLRFLRSPLAATMRCTLAAAALAVGLPAGTASAQTLSVPATTAPGIRVEGPYTTAPITLEGATLFRIVAPTNPLPGQVPIEVRQLDIENALARIIAIGGTGAHQHTLYDPNTLTVNTVALHDQAVLEAKDAHHPTPVTVMTVTPVDAKYYGVTMTSLATRWSGILQHELREALFKRQPGVERRNLIDVLIAASVLAVVTVLAWLGLIVPLGRRAVELEVRISERGQELAHPQSAPTEETTQHQRRRFLALALRARNPERQLTVVRTLAATVIWVLLGLWLGALVWAFMLFPQTTPLAHEAVQTLLAVAATWICAGLINRILDLVIGRIAEALQRAPHENAEERARELLRIPTVSKAASSFKTVLIVFIALLITLGEVGIPVWSVVTFGGLTAIGITLAAQNFVRDFVNGFLVLSEDQYVVGDYITINSQSGIVENLTLRMAQIRDTAGNLVTIPHSSVTTVVNHSRNWSRVDYRVSIDPSADAEQAMKIVQQAVQQVAAQDRWRGVVLEPVEWIGVESFSRDGMVIRALIKTAPLRQFELRRAINERVHRALTQAGIGFGAPVPDAAP